MPKRGPDVIVRKRDGYRLLWMPEHPDARRGHEQIPENLYVRKTNGHRLCKLCVAIDNRERWAKKRARA